MTISLPETTDCNATGAICTEDKRSLSHSLSATVIDAAMSTSGDMAKGDIMIDLDDALVAASGTTPDEAAAALFGEAELGERRLDALDRLGNRNGRYDLGDFVAWRERCRQGGADSGAGATHPGPAAAATTKPGPAGSRRRSGRPGGGRDPGRRPSRRDPGRRPSGPTRRTRRRGGMRRQVLAALFAAATAWSCADGEGPAGPAPAVQDPGLLRVELAGPAANRDVGVLLQLEGPGIETVRALGFELFESGASGRRQVILAGSLGPGPLLQFHVPDRNLLPLYRIHIVQVTGEDYGLRDPGDYRARISH